MDRTDTLLEAIALSSPDGRMSKRARAAASERLRVALFGPAGLAGPKLPDPPTRAEQLRRRAATLRDLAARGMRRRAYTAAAERLEREAAKA